MKIGIVEFLVGISFGLSTLALAAPPAEQCPQPRFTGKAPDPDYSRTSPLEASKDNLSAGRKIYFGKDGRFGCEACHGKKGEGNGELSGQFNPRPRNFACPQTVNAIPDGQLFWIIRNGSPNTAMPPHPDYSDTEIWQVLVFLRSLASSK